MSFLHFSRKQVKSFAFDHCFNSLDPGDIQFAGQEQVFQCLGHDILDNAFQGYNACIFAYGQTGNTTVTRSVLNEYYKARSTKPADQR